MSLIINTLNNDANGQNVLVNSITTVIAATIDSWGPLCLVPANKNFVSVIYWSIYCFAQDSVIVLARVT